MIEMIDVAAAVIVDENNKVFIARKRQGLSLEGLWEFPGGKIEKGETAAQAIERELMEEMNLKVAVGAYLGESVYAYEALTVRLIAHYSRIIDGDMRLSDHDRCEWVSPEELHEYTMAPADEPIRKLIENRNGSGK